MNKWDERYSRGENLSDAPHPLVVEYAAKLKPGRALDVACGAGRHAIWLAERGWRVTAVDYSRVAIEILLGRARERGLTIDARVADLERDEFSLEPRSYDLIVNCGYLQRDLFPAIRAGVRVGGLVLAVIKMADDDPGVKPINPAFLLDPGELRAEFSGWELWHDYEGKPRHRPHPLHLPGGNAEIVARRMR